MKGSKYLSVRVPTRSYLKKFAHYKLGETLYSDGHDPIQQYLTAVIEKKSYFYRFEQLNNQFKTEMVFFITKSQFLKSGFGIKPANIVNFNLFLETLFDNELYNYCNDYLKYYEVSKKAVFAFIESQSLNIQSRQVRKLQRVPTLKDALESFAAKLSIEIDNDISFEGLKKMEYRARCKKIFSPVVPSIQNGVLTMQF